jgi:glucuronoarabinoxylan endo-1,4-beta-xylanase
LIAAVGCAGTRMIEPLTGTGGDPGGVGGASGAGGDTGAGGAPAVVCAMMPAATGLITDFSDWNQTAMRWGTAPGMTGSVSADALTASVNSGALHLSGAVAGSGGVALPFDGCVDASAYAGVQFTVTPGAGTCPVALQVDTTTNPGNTAVLAVDSCADGCDAATSQSLTFAPNQAATVVTVPWFDLQGDGAPNAFNMRAISGLRFQLTTSATCTADVAISNLRFATGADIADVAATVDTTQPHQLLTGFGAAIAWYGNFATGRNIDGDDLYDVIFAQLGLDILRLGNWYQNQVATGATTSTPFSDDVGPVLVQKATASLGHPPLILMSSWSPPSYLKSNGSTKTTSGTLASTGGSFAYPQFGQWWVSSLIAYAAHGIVPDFISIQNEPDFFNAGWETCFLDPLPGTNAGYGAALDAVYAAVQASSDVVSKPRLVGPEVTGIAGNNTQNYLAGINPVHIGVVAHHLYNGGDSATNPAPDSYLANMTAVANAAASIHKPVFMTEYSPTLPDMVRLATVIHNALTVEQVSAYLHWGLIWGGQNKGELVNIEDPTAAFTTPKGYTINDNYYAMKHFARWTDPGWTRVDATTSLGAVRISAFVSPNGKSVTAVMINLDTVRHVVALGAGGFTYGTAAVYRSSGASERTAQMPLGAGGTIMLPPSSVATVTLTP